MTCEPATFQRLRDAATAVLNLAADPPGNSDRLHATFTQLHRALIGIPDTDTTDAGMVADPTRHLIGLYRYRGTTRYPIPLAEEAADIRRELAGDHHKPEAPVHRRDGSTVVVLTELQAMIIGSLLRELAARLTPGAAFGPTENGIDLAAAAADLAELLIDQTTAGTQ